MKNYKQNLLKVGSFIDKNDYLMMKKKFNEKGITEKSQFFIKKDHILDTLNYSQDVSGIKFTFGLKDTNDPNSKSLFLFPCNLFEGEITMNSIVPKNGFINHQGERYDISETMRQVGCHIKHRMKVTYTPYKEIPRLVFFGKDSLLELLATKDCYGLNAYMGIDGLYETIIFEPVDKDLQSLELFFDRGSIAPPPSQDDEAEDCIATAMMEHLIDGSEEKLNTYRAFRDQYLLESEERIAFSELYYLISPIMIRETKDLDQKSIMEELYNTKIKMLEKLIENNQFQKAFMVLKEVLEKLTNKYTEA